MRYISDDLLNKIKQKEMTIYNNAEPHISVDIARAKTAVTDSSYWTIEEIRSKPGIGSIEVDARRYNTYHGRPDKLVDIYDDNGTIKVGHREYPDLEKIGWVHDFDIGAGSEVSVCFNGEFKSFRESWRLQTEENPWIFWTDAIGDLYRQYWDDASTKELIDSNVTKVVSLRGWKEINNGNNDLGLIVGYVKTDGTAWYTNYCIQTDKTYLWETSKEVTGFSGDAVNIDLFLLNDYRVGIVIENNLEDIYWLITKRTWVGMAIEQTNIVASITDLKVNVIPINYIDSIAEENITAEITDLWVNVAEPIYPSPVSAENPDKIETEIHLIFSHLIDFDLTTVANAFSIKDSLNAEINILSTSPGIDNSEIVFTTSNFAGITGNVFIAYDRSIIELNSINQGSAFAIDSFNLEFTPELEPPEGYMDEHISASITDVVLNTTKVTYTNSYADENLTSNITDVVVVVTKVGDNPL